MTKVKFIHTGDIHMDTPFKGLLDNTELRKKLKRASDDSFKHVVDMAIQKQVDFVVITGDIFDADQQSFLAQYRFIDQLTRLSRNNISTYFICGNHDPLLSWSPYLKLPKLVYRFSENEFESYIYKKDGLKIAISGMSYQNATPPSNLISYYNEPVSADFSIALYHGNIGNQSGHDNAAPAAMESLINKQFDYWALGHIHKPMLLRKSTPVIAYPGIPQGRDFGESGNKGFYLIEWDSQFPEPLLQFIPNASVRFESLLIDISNITNIYDLPEIIEQQKTNIPDYQENCRYMLRIFLTGTAPLHADLQNEQTLEEIKQSFNEHHLYSGYFSWIDKIEAHTKPDIDLTERAQTNDFIGSILQDFNTLESDSTQAEELLNTLANHFKSEARHRYLDLDSILQNKTEILTQAKWKLLNHFKLD